jgi:hypothetical protein
MATKHKDNWLANSKNTFGDGNLSKQDAIKGKKADSPIGNFGNKTGGSKAPAGGGKATFTKGLMQKGK